MMATMVYYYMYFFLFGFLGARDPMLETYSVGAKTISISGISSGAAMATQMHVIHSATIMGAGSVAGVPFACAGGTLAGATACMLTPGLESVMTFEFLTTSGSFVGNVDSTSHLRHDKVYIFSGTRDSVIKHANGPKIQQFYQHYISDRANIKAVFQIPAEHCMVVNSAGGLLVPEVDTRLVAGFYVDMPTDNYGGKCDVLSASTGYINNCHYSAAYDLLNHIYGDIRKPANDSSAPHHLVKFDQSEFFHLAPASTYSMDTTGYVYVPEVCSRPHTACKLHVALHGCQMGRHTIGETYVRHAGYNSVAELNNIIILYPQVIPTLINPQGCWDWWGYTGIYYGTKHGFQITALRRMIQRASGH